MMRPLLIWWRNVIFSKEVPVIGVTGTGGAGKSSLLMINAGVSSNPDKRVCLLCVDPTKKRIDVLGDRIRMNLQTTSVHEESASRGSGSK